MNMQLIIKMTSMLVLSFLLACSQAAVPTPVKNESSSINRAVAGSYIAQAPGDGEQVIRSVFAEYGVVLVHALGNDQYELRLSRDPGLDILTRLVAASDGKVKSIQANFIYHSF